MDTYILDKDNYSIDSVIELLEKGRTPLCPVCKSHILVARTPEQARQLAIPPGMQCSKSARHFQVEFLLRVKKSKS